MTSVEFSNNPNFFVSGLGDGIVKAWNLSKQEVIRNYKGTIQGNSPITSISLSKSNTVLASSNAKGIINLFPTNDLVNKSDPLATSTMVSQLFSLQES